MVYLTLSTAHEDKLELLTIKMFFLPEANVNKCPHCRAYVKWWHALPLSVFELTCCQLGLGGRLKKIVKIRFIIGVGVGVGWGGGRGRWGVGRWGCGRWPL